MLNEVFQIGDIGMLGDQPLLIAFRGSDGKTKRCKEFEFHSIPTCLQLLQQCLALGFEENAQLRCQGQRLLAILPRHLDLSEMDVVTDPYFG